jgi:hypothetical protein
MTKALSRSRSVALRRALPRRGSTSPSALVQLIAINSAIQPALEVDEQERPLDHLGLS